jgi:hypothetical protein
MDAYLMGSSSFQTHGDIAVRSESCQNTIMSYCRPTRVRHRHPGAMPGVATNRGIDCFTRNQSVVADGTVFTSNSALFKIAY